MRLSEPVDVTPYLSRRFIPVVMRHVWLHGGRTPGLDGKTRMDVFGDGPGGAPWRRTRRDLTRFRHGYRFGALRTIEIEDVRGKVRQIDIAPLKDRIVLYALVLAWRQLFEMSPVSIQRPGLDGRWSVAALALFLRDHTGGFLRTDFEKAFDSILWPTLLEKALEHGIPEGLVQALRVALETYRPSGRGVPLGISFSSDLLHFACSDLDRKLSKAGIPFYRYMDDSVGLPRSETEARTLLEMINAEVSMFGLHTHPGKTSLFDAERIDWLGHEIDRYGAIDVAEVAVASAKRKMEEMSPEKRNQYLQAWANHFVLARGGRRYRSLVPNDPPIQIKREKLNQDDHSCSDQNPHNSELPCDSEHGQALFWALASPALGPVSVAAELSAGTAEPLLPADASAGDPYGSVAMGNLHDGRDSIRFARSRSAADSAPDRRRRPDRRQHRGGRGSHMSRPPRHRIIDVTRIEVFGGLLLTLRAADLWSERDRRSSVARILFGVDSDKVHQLARAYRFLLHVLELFASRGREFSDSQQEKLIQDSWSVLAAAGTLRCVESLRCVKADPFEELMMCLSGQKICRHAKAGRRSVVMRRRPSSQRGEPARSMRRTPTPPFSDC